VTDLQQALYLIADEMRGMATIGKHFAHNIYEVERAHRIMELAAKIAAMADEQPPEMVKQIFESEPWQRISPAVGVEAAVFNPQRELLLIQRRDNGNWCIPGGVAEIGQTFSEAVLRELWEEAGMRGTVKRLLGVFDGRLWASQSKVHLVHLIFHVECPNLTPKPGVEAVDARFFDKAALPPLHRGHTVRVPKCFDLLSAETYFDPAESLNGEMPMHQHTNQDE
jgi:8-oxo-dGTP pyrophosphatase MutT (NUDIX family)